VISGAAAPLLPGDALEQAGRRPRHPLAGGRARRGGGRRQRRLAGGEQPGVEQRVQLLPGAALGERDELSGGAVA
jgi:hypothetical protein